MHKTDVLFINTENQADPNHLDIITKMLGEMFPTEPNVHYHTQNQDNFWHVRLNRLHHRTVDIVCSVPERSIDKDGLWWLKTGFNCPNNDNPDPDVTVSIDGRVVLGT